MNDTKRCPACNQQVPALAVRCKFCGIRLDTQVPEIPPAPLTEPPGDEDDDLDLSLDDDLSNAAIPIAALSARLSAPPPARSPISTAPPARGPISTSPPFRAAPVSAPPPAPATAPRVSAGPPAASQPSSMPPIPPTSRPAPPAISSPPPFVTAPVGMQSTPPVSHSTASSPKQTMLGMAPVTLPQTGGSPLPRPSTSPVSTSSGGGLDIDDFEPTPMPQAPPPGSVPLMGGGPALGGGVPPIADMPPVGHDDLFSQHGFDSLDLDGDIIDDDVDEISKFTEQTAITDVSTLALGMGQMRPDEPVDVSQDILDDIMESTPSAAAPLPSAPPKPQPYVPHSSVPPAQGVRPPSGAYPSVPAAHPSSGAYPPISGVRQPSGAYPSVPAAHPSGAYPSVPAAHGVPTSRPAHAGAPVPAGAPRAGAMPTQPVLPSVAPTAVTSRAPLSRDAGLRPLGPMLESDTGIHVFAARKSPTKAISVVIGLLVLVGGGFIAYQLLGTDETPSIASESQAESEPKTDQAANEEPSKGGVPADQKTADSENKATQTKGHKCKSLSAYPSFAWRDKLDTLAKATNKSSFCGLFGVSKEDVVTAMRGTPNFGPTGYDLLPKSTVFEIFPLGKAERRAPSIELIFADDLLFEIRMNYATTESSSLDPEIFKSALGAPKVVTDDPLGREIKIYTDEDMVVFWYRRTDAFKRVFNELVFSSRIVRGTMEKALKDRNDAQIAFGQAMVLFNQKQPMRAVGKFRDARKIIPQMGNAYIFEGLALLQNEQFDKLESVADQAFENSTDDRARAGAKGLQAVVALYRGDKDGALSLFNNAAGLDPTDAEFSTSVEELKSGNYDPSRVAKTAARMECRKNHPEWSVKGLLARGNFPSDDVFEKAEKSAKKKPGYKAAFDMWNAWECK